MNALEVLFVHSNGAEIIFQDLHKISATEPPIWAGLLAQACRVKGHEVAILDCEVEQLTTKESAEKIIAYGPKIACFVVYGQNPNASTQNMEGSVATAVQLREIDPSIRIMFIGAHVAALPKEVLGRHKEIDFIAQNEGVYCILDLLKVDLNDECELSQVKGLGFRAEGKHTQLNPINKIVPKDRLEVDLPGMAWDLMDIKKYRTAPWHSWTNNTEHTPFAALYTSLGCKFACNFCMINSINRVEQGDHITAANSNVFRWWEPEFIIKEFEKLAAMGVKNVKIADELFVYMPRHFMKVCELIIERGYEFNIWCYSRVDTCKPEYLETLYKAGVRWLGIGIENPNQTLRKEVHKGGYKEVRIDDLFKMMRDHNISIGANYIYGLPMDTQDSIKYTEEFMMKNLTENVNLYCAMALPGSPLYYEAVGRGAKLPDRYAGFSQYGYYTQPLDTDNLTAEEILRCRDDTWNRYFTNPEYLKMMELKFGKKCVDNINSITPIKLKRRLLGDTL